jgi:thioredoxin reductase (NADPH)
MYERGMRFLMDKHLNYMLVRLMEWPDTACASGIASGARYRRPTVPRFASKMSPHWKRICAPGEEVAIIGGGNSAGQAAVFFENHASKVHMLIRGEGLSASMSRYLIELPQCPRSSFTPTRKSCSSVAMPSGGLHPFRGAIGARASRQHTSGDLFVFVGADSETEWLRNCGVELDLHGFVLTGASVQAADGRAPIVLESSVPGVYAVGDVRSGSVKRVGRRRDRAKVPPAVVLIHERLSKVAVTSHTY